MRKRTQRNFAFIDAQNVIMSIRRQGWNMDWKKLRVYLRDKYDVDKAFVFIGFIEKNTAFYDVLRRCGYIVIFKPVITVHGEVKGNCDGDMIVYIMSRLHNYNRAVIVTNDGDFYSVIRFLRHTHKLAVVLSPDRATCSKLVKKEAGFLVDYMNNLRYKLSLQ